MRYAENENLLAALVFMAPEPNVAPSRGSGSTSASHQQVAAWRTSPDVSAATPPVPRQLENVSPWMNARHDNMEVIFDPGARKVDV